MESGIGIGTGPANIPEISPASNMPPSRSEITDDSESAMEAATGAAKAAHAPIVSSTQSALVSTRASPAGGFMAQAVSSHRLASLSARRASCPSSALTVACASPPLTLVSATDLASLTLIGPSSMVRCMSPMVLSPPAESA